MSEGLKLENKTHRRFGGEFIPAVSVESAKNKEIRELSEKRKRFLGGLQKLMEAGILMTGLVAGGAFMAKQWEIAGRPKVEDVSKKSEDDEKEEQRIKEWKKKWPTASPTEREYATRFGEFPSAEKLKKFVDEQALNQNIERLERQFGRENIPLDWTGREKTEATTADDTEQHANFEKIIIGNIAGSDGAISRSEMARLLRKFPRGWVWQEVNFISQRGEKYHNKDLSDKYGIKDAVTAATCKGGVGEYKSDIILYESTTARTMRDNFQTIAHELAHSNDWGTDQELSHRERLDLLETIGNRLLEQDRYHSWYVESIQNPDKQKEQYLKASEYWAEITAQYFTNPHQLNIKDFKIVDRQIRRYDPKYNIKALRDEMALLSKPLS